MRQAADAGNHALTVLTANFVGAEVGGACSFLPKKWSGPQLPRLPDQEV